MCTLAAFVGVFRDHPLVIAANRDEYLERPATPPVVLRGEAPRALGGRDLIGGGTWLGVSETGLVVGVLNRRSPAPPDLACRSRGLLCLDLLGAASATEAAERVAGEPAGRYNPFNLLIADRTAAFVVSQPHRRRPTASRLDPGLHLLTNLDVNDPTCPRIASSHRRFAGAGAAYAEGGDVAAFIAHLQTILADHATALDPRGPGSLCVHGDAFGTRSSSVLLVGAVGRPTVYFHADGPPCRTRLQPIALAFRRP